MSRVLPLILVLVVLPAAAHCGRSPVAPSGSPENSQPTPRESLVVASYQGWIEDSGGRAISGAVIEAIDGPQAGYTMTADAQGRFSVPGSFDETVTFRASHDGHIPATGRIRAIGSFKWLGFSLLVLAPNVNIAGEFTLTVSADPACASLPNSVRIRSYTARIALEPVSADPAQNTRFMVVVSGPTIRASDPINRPFIILVAGDYLNFATDDGHHAPFLSEELEDGGAVTLTGAAETFAVEPVTTIAASMRGSVGYVSPEGARADCASGQHRLLLTRQ